MEEGETDEEEDPRTTRARKMDKSRANREGAQEARYRSARGMQELRRRKGIRGYSQGGKERERQIREQ